jgi:hypothetical protein
MTWLHGRSDTQTILRPFWNPKFAVQGTVFCEEVHVISIRTCWLPENKP